MYKSKKVLAIIPARGGSKGVKQKNIKILKDKPLLAWTIMAAKSSKYIDKLVVSTDDLEIAEIAKKYSCEVPFIRPKELAEDDTPGIDVILHAVETVGNNYDIIVMLQPTSPLRDKNDIDKCIEQAVLKNRPCVSVTIANKSPYWMYSLSSELNMEPIIEIEEKLFYQRQKLPEVYQLNGAVYVSSYENLIDKKSFITKNTIAYVMDEEKSVDIDTDLDFMIAECIIEKHLGK